MERPTMTDDASPAAIAVLGRYFSEPVARELLGVSRRREGLEGRPLSSASLARVVGALERALPSYVADPERRRRCLDDLRGLVSESADRSPASDRGAPSSPSAIAVSRPEHLHGVAEAARAFARTAGFGLLDQTKIATAVAELTRNMLQYAGGGEIWLGLIDAPQPVIEIAAVDRGPGIADVALVMSAGYRSRTGMGLGLKGVKRIVDEMDIQSSRAGTRVVIRKRRS